MANTVSDWVQLVLNGGALIIGAAVWRLYIQNLKTTIGAKESEVSLANKQVEYWREKASELEKRSPEVVEQVLEARIATRGAEIERLAADKEHSTRELDRAEYELNSLRRILEQTKGFQQILAMEQPDPDDPDYQEYLDYVQERNDRVVDVEVVHMGAVGVDSGQLLLTDPCYIDQEWSDEPFEHDRIYTDVDTGKTITWRKDFDAYDEILPPYEKTPEELIASGRLVQVPSSRPETFNYSYNGACQATLSDGYGQLVYNTGHAGAGVAFQSGWGDGFYDVYGEIHDGRIVRVYVNLGADPPPPLALPASSGRDDAEGLSP